MNKENLEELIKDLQEENLKLKNELKLLWENYENEFDKEEQGLYWS